MNPIYPIAVIALSISCVMHRESLKPRLEPDTHTVVAVTLGTMVFLASSTMLIFGRGSFAASLIHYGFIYTLAGFLFPIAYVLFVEKRNLAALGICRNKLRFSIIVNVTLGILMAYVIYVGADWISIDKNNFVIAGYTLLIGSLFELLLYYGFIHLRLRKAFGHIPAILGTSFLYVLWHVGAELTLVENPWITLLDLFMVGVFYQSVFSLTHNLAIVWPFFLGAGVMIDYTLQIEAIDAVVPFAGWATLSLTLMVYGSVFLYWRWYRSQPINDDDRIS